MTKQRKSKQSDQAKDDLNISLAILRDIKRGRRLKEIKGVDPNFSGLKEPKGDFSRLRPIKPRYAFVKPKQD
jgi:hypothetical protein